MKKPIIVMMAATLLLSGCDTYAGAGAYTGTTLGSVLGSAIGGIAGGPRGSDIGTIVGMAGGAIVGGAIGQAKDQKQQEELDQYKRDKAERAASRAHRRHAENGVGDVASHSDWNDVATDDTYGSGFDATNSGDDRIYDFNSSDYTGDYTAQQPETTMPLQSGVDEMAQGFSYTPTLEVVNARFVDANQNGQIERGELCKIIFEVMNRGPRTVYDIQPTVVEATGNKHIFVSPNMHVEQIQPGKGIRYTAVVKADGRLKNGSAKFCVSVIQGNTHISKVTEFNIPTVK